MLNIQQFEKQQKAKKREARKKLQFSQAEVNDICSELGLNTKAYKKFLVNKKEAI